jgi:hypothetical protein
MCLFRSDTQHKRIDLLQGLFYIEFNFTSVPYLSIEVVNIFELISISMLWRKSRISLKYQCRSHVTLPVVMASRILWNTVTKQL